ncbi:sugar phosphate isomerase/epimerase [Cyanobium sp. Morenito 9A2]|nr:sugar phosphate isomerase/epimerase [Cyanobium sp. Morenito 9A2]
MAGSPERDGPGAAPLILQTLWGFEGSLAEAIDRSRAEGFDGMELNLRHSALEGLKALAVRSALEKAERTLILELVTGGAYVPDLGRTTDQHLEELDGLLAEALVLQPLKVNVITGSDSWGWVEQQRFWGRALGLVERYGLNVSFETHRSRCLANPWGIARTLEAFPALRLTADLSHWCVLAERLMTPELAPIQAMASRVDHIHARVGWSQGPQVSHPFAPEHHEALEAHGACWALFAERHHAQDRGALTVTPEFGPDGYLPTLPFTNQPVADLGEVNRAMARWVRELLG